MNKPRLRFKEFSGDWEVKTLREVSELITKGTTPKSFSDSGIKFIKIECFEGDRINEKKCLFINEDSHKKELKRSILLEGDILFAIAGATIGKCNIVTSDILPANTNQALCIIRLRKHEAKEFIFYILKSNRMQRYIVDTISVGAQPNLNLEQMGSFLFHTPSRPEQTAIANFLTAIDEKIAQLTQKCELLARYKKGVMQQIFSQQLRFKDDDGREFPEWEEKSLGEICDFNNGKAHENIISDDGDFIVINSKFISTEGKVYKRSSSAMSPIKKDTVTLVMSDIPNGKALAKCFYVNKDEIYTLNQRIGGLKSKSENNKFLFYQLNRNPYYLAFDGGMGQTNLKKEEVLNCPLILPCVEEQTKIANFLTAIDEKTSNNQTQLNALKQYKQGLLQQLFV